MYWWQDEDADDEEDLNAGARKVYLEEKGINAKMQKTLRLKTQRSD